MLPCLTLFIGCGGCSTGEENANEVGFRAVSTLSEKEGVEGDTDLPLVKIDTTTALRGETIACVCHDNGQRQQLHTNSHNTSERRRSLPMDGAVSPGTGIHCRSAQDVRPDWYRHYGDSIRRIHGSVQASTQSTVTEV